MYPDTWKSVWHTFHRKSPFQMHLQLWAASLALVWSKEDRGHKWASRKGHVLRCPALQPQLAAKARHSRRWENRSELFCWANIVNNANPELLVWVAIFLAISHKMSMFMQLQLKSGGTSLTKTFLLNFTVQFCFCIQLTWMQNCVVILSWLENYVFLDSN